MKRNRMLAVTVAAIAVASIFGVAVLGGCGTDTATVESLSLASSAATSPERSGGSPAEAVAAMTGPSVVNVRVSGTSTSPFFGRQPYEGVGSGVIYTSDGYIITNAHVVTQSGRLADEVEVTFSSGEMVPATIVATDPFTDIAVIEVQKTGMPAATFAIDSMPTLGEYAIAIGSPLDYSNSVTLGIVSGLGRSIENSGSTALVDLIQTDAAISPGNSGGALVDEEGRVIGINVAYLPPNTTGAENIGFAIPAATAVRVADELITNGRASHAYLGVNYVSVTAALQRQYGLSRDTGVLITALAPRGPAARGGLEVGDILLDMGGRPIESETDMILILRDLRPGESVPVTVDRDGEALDLNITVGERSASTN